MARKSKWIHIAVFVLRIVTLSACVASGVFLVLDNFTFLDLKNHFQDIITFRYVVSAATIGAAYSMLQLPFSIYYAFTRKRLIRHTFMRHFDFIADYIVSLVLATGVGAGFGVSMELKKLFKELLPVLGFLGSEAGEIPEVREVLDPFFLGLGPNLDQAQSKYAEFFDKAILATGFLLIGAVCMTVVSILTSINRTSNSGYFK